MSGEAWTFLGAYFTGLIGVVIALISNRNSASKESLKLLTDRVTSLEKENECLDKALTATKDELTATKIELTKTKLSLEHTQTKLDQKEKDIQRLTDENEQLRKEVNALQAQAKRRTRKDDTNTR